ncbi:MAG: ABC transporter permease, partial [Clostridia bacterium]|nr:ABC transporter permease [Clostridia bacterium]
MTLFLTWFVSAIKYGTVILYGAMGEIVTEKAGHLNLGTPGIMVFGGAFGFISGFTYENACAAAGTSPNPFILLVITLLSAFLMGVLAGMIYAFLTVSLRANQNVTGLTLTIFGVGAAKFFASFSIPQNAVSIRAAEANRIYAAKIPVLSKIPVIGELFFSYGFMVYVSIAIAIIMMLILHKTRIGLNLRAIGESPATAD